MIPKIGNSLTVLIVDVFVYIRGVVESVQDVLGCGQDMWIGRY